VIYNFFTPRRTKRSRDVVRADLGVGEETLLLHASNLRPLKRIDVLLEAIARCEPREPFKLLILAGGSLEPYRAMIERLGIGPRIIVRDNVRDIEEYLQAADVGVITSDTESFCLTILEAMCFGCPSVATRVGGIPEVVDDGATGRLVPAGNAAALQELVDDKDKRRAWGAVARTTAARRFSADVIVPQYEALYRRLTQ
jgi:glycosyltransferase involved in cell wall biosynthesis